MYILENLTVYFYSKFGVFGKTDNDFHDYRQKPGQNSSSAELAQSWRDIWTEHVLDPSINLLFNHMDGFTFCLKYFGSSLNLFSST